MKLLQLLEITFTYNVKADITNMAETGGPDQTINHIENMVGLSVLT